MMGGNLGAAVQMLKVINQQGGSQSWESYWASRTNMDIKSRSDNVMVDDYGNDATILFPYYYKPTTTFYASVADNSALDIGASDFTICGWIKSEQLHDATKGIMGKYSGTHSGGYGICVSASDGLFGILRTSTGYWVVYDAENIINYNGSGAWLFVVFEVELAVSKLRMFVNNAAYGETTFTGTISTMAADRLFYIGRTYTDTASASSYSDIQVFHRLLTPTEKTTLYNRGYVVGAAAYWPCIEWGWTLYDVSGNDIHLTKINIESNYPQTYDAGGSKYCLDKGYSEYYHPVKTMHVPLKLDGTEQSITETSQVIKKRKVAGSLTSHNMADSIIEFVGDEWDRSNVTRFGSMARSLKYWYDASNPKRWHPELLNNLLFQSWANTGYKGFQFVKIVDHSYKDRNTLSEIITTTLEQTGTSYVKAMEWADDYVFDETYENDLIYWKMTPNLIRAVNGAKYFAYEAGKVKLSLDNGLTYPYEKAIVGLTAIHMAWIFSNGNIVFAALVGEVPKIYYSTDNLANITECTVLDTAGNPYSPVNKNCYMWATLPIYHTIGTKDVMAWANYNTLNTNNIWCTTDYGVTIKQIYLDGTTTPPNLDADNLHGIVYTGADKKFWIWSGDGTDECNVIEGTYDDVADTWVWAKIAGDNDGGSAAYSNYTYYKIGGFIFDSGYVYWVSDSDNPARKKIYRCLRADFGVTPANYETLFNNGVFLFDFELFGSDMLTSNLRKDNDQFHWILGLDKTKWYNIPLYNHVITTDYKNQFIFGIDSNGWVVSNAPDYNGSLLTKIK